MTSQIITFKFKVTYENGTADQHRLDMYDAAISYLGFSKALNITLGAILNKQVKVRGNNSSGIKVYLETSKKGSFEQLISIAIQEYPVASTVVLGASGSGLWEAVKFIWGGLVDQVQPKPNKKIMDRIEPILGELQQALETPLQEAHRPISNDENIEIEITFGRKTGSVKFDKNTLKLVSEKVADKIEDGKVGNVTKYNNISHIGRFFDEDLDKTVSFHSEALSKYEQELLTWSLHESNKDINKGKLKTSVIPIKTLKGKLKRYDFVDVEKA